MLKVIGMLLPGLCCLAQPLPMGTWRAYPSFNRILNTAVLNNTLYASADNGVIVINGNEIETLTLPLLGSTGITALGPHAAANELLIGYETGQLDIVQNHTVFRYGAIRNNASIAGSKKINHILVQNQNAYLATDFGVVVFDLSQREIRETWRNLGPAGEALAVFETAIKDDSIFLATSAGIQGGSLQDNLLDFTRWKRFDQGSFNRPFTSIVSYNGFLFTAIPNDGLYRYNGTTWERLNYLTVKNNYRLFGSSNFLYVIADNSLYRVNTTETVEEISDALFTEPQSVAETAWGLAIGDGKNGLITGNQNAWQNILPNGPAIDRILRLRMYRERIYALPGGYTNLFTPAGTMQPVNVYQVSLWNTEPSWLDMDVTDVAFSSNRVCVSSFSNGIQLITPDNTYYFNESNSPLAGSRVTAVTASNDIFWIANYNSAQPLHRLNTDNTFTSFAFPFTAARYPLDILTDRAGQVWMRLNQAAGGGLLVFNPTSSNYVYLNEIPGGGGLPSRNVYSLTTDRSGWVWAGTDAGVAFFPDPEQVFSGNVNAVKPVFEGSFLLSNEKVTAIAVDAGNRKWFGTDRGLWLFDATVSNQLQYFNTTNAPLPSNRIRSLVIDGAGNLMVATDQGMAVYRLDASEPVNAPTTIKIFPNPVPPGYTGLVGISGLGEGYTVRITSLSGRLIWEAAGNGGTVAWNVRDFGGQRPPAGIYLVFAVSADGRETLAGKLALIN
ncbi:MAG: ABC transporter substrate-binding protein [Cyclobacteriaceae bacterium]|nr:MAG: ABC transporter substrate-binding protein [Cyclobacteriaceae bacterium]